MHFNTTIQILAAAGLYRKSLRVCSWKPLRHTFCDIFVMFNFPMIFNISFMTSCRLRAAASLMRFFSAAASPNDPSLISRRCSDSESLPLLNTYLELIIKTPKQYNIFPIVRIAGAVFRSLLDELFISPRELPFAIVFIHRPLSSSLYEFIVCSFGTARLSITTAVLLPP